jgi:hypothetical protein
MDPNNKLIGAPIRFRQEGQDKDGNITGLSWMPADPGFNPQLIATVMWCDGSLGWKYLHQLKVTNPAWVLAAD